MKYIWSIFVVAFVLLFWYGWGSNIVTLYQKSDTMSTGQIVVRGVGIPIVPIGVVIGYIGK